MRSILLLGFLMGMRHALDADHLAAMASLATRSRSVRSTVAQGAAWGIGHTITLLIVGGAVVILGMAISDRVADALEWLVGIMLIALSVQIFWRLHRQRVHVHVHRHGDGTVHLHAHSHTADVVPAQALRGQPHREQPHSHEHAFPARALLVGTVHGLAGSAALAVVAAHAAGSIGLGFAYIALFGAGSVLGMSALSAVIALPLRGAARWLTGAHRGLEAAIGVATVVVGLRVLADVGWMPALFR